MLPILTPFLSRLKLPWLFLLSAAGLLLNLVIPDPLPFVDELLMVLLTAVLASIRKPRSKASNTDQAEG